MPILFIDSSADPELETWIGDLLRAAAQSVSLAGANLDDCAIRNVIAEKFPFFSRLADQKFKSGSLHDA